MATPGVLRNLTGECGEVVGGVAHCGDDHDDVVARLLLPGDALRDAQDPLRRPYRCTAVLLDYERHLEDTQVDVLARIALQVLEQRLQLGVRLDEREVQRRVLQQQSERAAARLPVAALSRPPHRASPTSAADWSRHPRWRSSGSPSSS